MTRTPLRAALVVPALAIGLSACQSPSPDPTTSAGAVSSTVSSAVSSAGAASGKTSGAVYVTGAKAGDDPCARVVSAIGYLGLSLLPAGQEEAQHWDGDVRGRFGYLRGTLEMYGPRLPASASAAVATIDGVAETLSRADTAGSRRPDLLRRYRKASAAVLTACGRS
ncbi:hypothetical protein [Microbispora sp. GKU 823]|uniref:hypothetical protein n=1 Tax=Microbispora sp. GKU 823 TaxID=1652100 RepID=UPI0009A328B6|nr:hypothetical protein [Microbispora sp. GKU 823]OPG11441.1 hypothetical protein B1L11_19985 [Microbispora sp. GKU 823]